MVPPRSQLDLDQAPSIIPDCNARTITTSTSSNLACYPLYRQPTIILNHLLCHQHTSTSPLMHPPTTTSTLPDAALSIVPNATCCLSTFTKAPHLHTLAIPPMHFSSIPAITLAPPLALF